MVAAVAASIVTAGAAAAAMGVALASMTLGQAMVVAALSSMAGSLASQIVSGQGINFGKIAQAGLIGAVTAGLTNGITFDGNSFGLSEWGQSLKGTNTLANLAGSNSAGGVLQAAKDGATGTIYQQAIGMVGTGLINAGVNTAFNGGSLGQAFLNNLVAQTAALGANEIGNSTDPLTLQNVAAHAALGCAAQGAMGADCASGAIGGATSAVVAPLVRDGLYDGQQAVTTVDNGDGTQTVTTSYDNRVYNAATAAIAMLAGGTLAGALGRDTTAAANAAQNEALNNATSTKTDTLKSAVADTGRAVVNTGIGMVEAVPNFLSGALPGYPDYVPFLDGIRLPYDNPDFGDTVSFLTSLGLVRMAGAGSGATSAADRSPAIQFGANDNQSFHTFRHVVNGGYDATAVQNAVAGNLTNIGASLPQGQYTGTVVVNGTTFKYSAFKLPDGTINVGRITPPR